MATNDDGTDSFLEPIMHDVDGGCSICLQDFKSGEDPIRTKVCRHVFHRVCLTGWLRSKDTCPLCRALINPDGASSFRREASTSADIGSEIRITSSQLRHFADSHQRNRQAPSIVVFTEVSRIFSSFLPVLDILPSPRDNQRIFELATFPPGSDLSASTNSNEIVTSSLGSGSQVPNESVEDSLGFGSEVSNESVEDSLGSGSEVSNESVEYLLGSGSEVSNESVEDSLASGSEVSNESVEDSLGSGSEVSNESVEHSLGSVSQVSNGSVQDSLGFGSQVSNGSVQD